VTADTVIFTIFLMGTTKPEFHTASCLVGLASWDRPSLKAEQGFAILVAADVLVRGHMAMWPSMSSTVADIDRREEAAPLAA
jgi:hypothetical protein